MTVWPSGANRSTGVVSPDSKWFVARGPDRKRYLYPLSGGEPTVIPGLEKEDGVDQRTADGRFLYIHRSNEIPMKVYRLEIATGRREPAYVYSYTRTLSDLYLVEGVK